MNLLASILFWLMTKESEILMVLRPYQIHAIKKSEKAAEHKGGFIWHATGSGKP